MFPVHSPVNLPDFELRNHFVLTADGRIGGTRSQEPWLGPLFRLVRGKGSCAWAVRVDVPRNIADEIDGLAGEEPPVSDFRAPPVHAERYVSLLRGEVDSGPAFTFPEEIVQPSGTVFIDDIASLDRHFTGWTASEIPCRTPIVAVVEEGYAVSACFSAWRSDAAAEAGLETAPAFRGRGLGPRVASGWALAIRASRSRSAVQHVVVQRRLSSGCTQVGAGDVCQQMEYPLGRVRDRHRHGGMH